jgi:hypothetical protein
VYHIIIFYRAEPSSLSPAVNIWWPGKVIDLFNLLPAPVWRNGNMPEGRCVDFIGGCFSAPEIDTNRMEVWNLCLRWERLEEWERLRGSRVFGEPWLKWLFEEIGTWEKPPILVDMELNQAIQGGKVLCRRVVNRHDPEKPLWVAPDSGVDR